MPQQPNPAGQSKIVKSAPKPPAGEVDDLLPPSAATGPAPAKPAAPAPPLPAHAGGGLGNPMAPPSPRGPVPNPMAPLPNPMAPAGAHAVSTPAHVPPAFVPSDPTGGAFADVADDATSRPRSLKRKRSTAGLVMMGIAFVAIAGVIGAVVVIMNNQKEEAAPPDQVAQNTNQPEEETPATAEETEEPTEETPSEPEAEESPDVEESPSFEPAAEEEMMESEPAEEAATKTKTRPKVKSVPAAGTPETEAMPAADPKQTAKLKSALAAARSVLGKRDFDGAAAQLKKAKALATTPEDEEIFEREELLHGYVNDFWQAVGEGIKGAPIGEGLELSSTTTFAIVQATDDSLEIRMPGQNKTYQLPDELPSGLARFFAERWYDKTKPQNKVFLGAFALVDPKGKAADARRLWEEAAEEGVDVEFLMPLVEEVDSGAAALPELLAAPSAQELAAAEKAFRKLAGAEVTAAKTAIKKLALAEKLLEDSASAEDPAVKFVTLSHARDLANDADDPELMVKAVDEMAKWFEVDAFAMKAETLAKATAGTAASAKAIADAGLEIMGQAATAEQYELAAALGKTTLAAARKARSPELVKDVTAKVKEIQAKIKE